MAVPKNVRQLLAHARALGEGERRTLIERLLPRGEHGKRAVHLANEADRDAVPLAIAAAVLDDEITSEEAEELKRQADDPSAVKPAEAQPRPDDWMAAFDRRLKEMEVVDLVVQGDRLVRVKRKLGDPSRCNAATERPGIVSISENTMAVTDGDAAGDGAPVVEHLETIGEKQLDGKECGAARTMSESAENNETTMK